MDTATIGHRLKLVRMQARMSQAEVASVLGLSLSQYAKAEIGLRNLSDAPLRLFCDHFGADRRWMETGDGTPPKPGYVMRPANPMVLRDAGTAGSHEENMTLMRAIEAISEQLHVPKDEVVDKVISIMREKIKGTP